MMPTCLVPDLYSSCFRGALPLYFHAALAIAMPLMCNHSLTPLNVHMASKRLRFHTHVHGQSILYGRFQVALEQFSRGKPQENINRRSLLNRE